MGRGSFRAALEAAPDLIAQDAPDATALNAAFATLNRDCPPELVAEDLRRIFALCYGVLGLSPVPGLVTLEPWARQRLAYQAEELLTALVVDDGARHRDFVQSTITRATALGRPPRPGAPTQPVPVPHRAIAAAEARDLMAPWLAAFEAGMQEDPLVHIGFCWRALTAPVPPFLEVITQWLRSLDARGLGMDSHQALERAMALVRLADEGVQRLTRENFSTELVPQLRDPHPLVAMAAGRYLGRICANPGFFIVRSQPMPLPEVLDLLAAGSVHRRNVAGGFLHGMSDGDMGDPFSLLDKALTEEGAVYDLDGWVLDIFAGQDPEPYLPAAQSFWFYVHEAFCAKPAFIHRLIDAGHIWEAMMCATEIDDRVAGMEPVLDRLIAAGDEEIAARARAWKADFYG
ncbi:MAG: hypothetical protein AAGF79_18775 [Pseudomonadota bacterium]